VIAHEARAHPGEGDWTLRNLNAAAGAGVIVSRPRGLLARYTHFDRRASRSGAGPNAEHLNIREGSHERRRFHTNRVFAADRSIRSVFRYIPAYPRTPGADLGPLFRAPVLRFVRTPVLRAAVRMFAAGRVKRVVDALKKAHLLRLAASPADSRADDWKQLGERAEAMSAGVSGKAHSPWVFATGAFGAVFLLSRAIGLDLALVSKIVATLVTAKPDKLAELAAEPGAPEAMGKLVIATIFLLIAITPLVTYHFRFTRILFNRSEPPPRLALRNTPVRDIWNERLTNAGSPYGLEADLFRSMGEPVTREVPWDLLGIMAAFAYQALGPGAAVAFFAAQVSAKNPEAGKFWYIIAGINMLIGFANVGFQLLAMRNRAKLQR
jgi:hypothetical protein